MTTDALEVPPQHRPAPPPTPPWSCENCAHANPARRRRCRDCGTSRD